MHGGGTLSKTGRIVFREFIEWLRKIELTLNQGLGPFPNYFLTRGGQWNARVNEKFHFEPLRFLSKGVQVSNKQAFRINY
jgi:hypothetical protein